QDFCFAAKLQGEAKPASCLFYLPAPPGAKYFDGLVANIEKLFETGRPPYPVERTLLTSGILDAAMESHFQRGARIETPQRGGGFDAPGLGRSGCAGPIEVVEQVPLAGLGGNGADSGSARLAPSASGRAA